MTMDTEYGRSHALVIGVRVEKRRSNGKKIMLPLNEDRIKKIYQSVCDITDTVYNSTERRSAISRYKKRVNAYYLRHESAIPQHRSKLYFARYHVACQALKADFLSAYDADTYIQVSAKDDGIESPEAKEAAQLANADLQYDLEVSGFRNKINQAIWYLPIAGMAAGREYMHSYQDVQQQQQIGYDAYNMPQETASESIKRVDRTCTDIIHPLNVAHDYTKSDFNTSPWESGIFEITVWDVKAMLGNDRYYQPHIKEIMESIEKGGGQRTQVSDSYYYSDYQDSRVNWSIVVEEYKGPIIIPGEKLDNTIYHMIFSRQYNKVLLIEALEENQHFYWKMVTNPDGQGIGGVDPLCGLYPVGISENEVVNSYFDYTKVALKFLYEVQTKNIRGGVSGLLNTLPGGFVQLDKDVKPGETFNQLKINASSLPPVGDLIQLIENYTQEFGPSKVSRGKGTAPNVNTAYGMSLMSEKEDRAVRAMQIMCDKGIVDAIHIKMHHMINNFSNTMPRYTPIKKGVNTEIVEHYPYEFKGFGFTYKVDREKSDIMAGKVIAGVKLIGELDKILAAKGIMLPAEAEVDLYERAMVSNGVPNAKEIMNTVRQAVVSPPPQINTMPGMPGAMQPMGAAPAQLQSKMTGEAENAMALA